MRNARLYKDHRKRNFLFHIAHFSFVVFMAPFSDLRFLIAPLSQPKMFGCPSKYLLASYPALLMTGPLFVRSIDQFIIFDWQLQTKGFSWMVCRAIKIIGGRNDHRRTSQSMSVKGCSSKQRNCRGLLLLYISEAYCWLTHAL